MRPYGNGFVLLSLLSRTAAQTAGKFNDTFERTKKKVADIASPHHHNHRISIDMFETDDFAAIGLDLHKWIKYTVYLWG